MGRGDWEADLHKQCREFIRRQALLSQDAEVIAEARELCSQLTHLLVGEEDLNDDGFTSVVWNFDTPSQQG